MSGELRVGIIGCGNISAAYMGLALLFRGFKLYACADMVPESASARASEFSLKALSVEDLLADDEIDIVVNLTVPNAHFAISRQILEAGRHLYSEKPFALSLAEGRELGRIANERGLRIGSAPDTFLGGAHQLVRNLLDGDAVGGIKSGTCFVQSPGMEMWHPNPDFFFKPGGGPILDLGPYYISNLVQLLGPVKRVAAMSTSAAEYRTITSKPRYGERIKVETPTTVHAIIEFRSGAQVVYCASWDVWKHGHSSMELYGSDGTLYVPDPNFFGGEVRISERSAFTNVAQSWDHPFSRAKHGTNANYRGAGLADMAAAILDGRPHRCSHAFALHAVDVMTSILASGETGQFVDIVTECERPAPLGPLEAEALLA